MPEPTDAAVGTFVRWGALVLPTQDFGFVKGIAFRHVLHFLSSSIFSRTRNAVILLINGRGSGFSNGNWIDPRAVLNFERSFAKAFTAEGVG